MIVSQSTGATECQCDTGLQAQIMYEWKDENSELRVASALSSISQQKFKKYFRAGNAAQLYLYLANFPLWSFCHFQETRSNEESTDESEVSLLKMLHASVSVSASSLSVWRDKYYLSACF